MGRQEKGGWEERVRGQGNRVKKTSNKKKGKRIFWAIGNQLVGTRKKISIKCGTRRVAYTTRKGTKKNAVGLTEPQPKKLGKWGRQIKSLA